MYGNALARTKYKQHDQDYGRWLKYRQCVNLGHLPLFELILYLLSILSHILLVSVMVVT